MLARNNRIRHGRDIARVATRGSRGSSGPLAMKALANRLPASRVAIVVSKKVSKRATARNRMRRRLSGLLAEQWATVIPGYDIVITMRGDVTDMPPRELEKNLLAAAERAGVVASK